jgi:uncharacterized membrane-anchored protein YitT (DUF2179 family)
MKRAATLVVAVLIWAVAPAAAHDIPTDVRVQLFLRPQGQVLRLVARMPVAAMNDVEWPLDGVFLDLARTQPVLAEAVDRWIAKRIDIDEGDRRLSAARISAVRISLPADTSFGSYETALSHVTAPALADDTEVVARQAWVDALLEYDIASDRSLFSIEPRFSLVGLQTLTVVRFLPASGVERAFQFHNDPGLVPLDPRWFQAASRFVVDGFFHILGGIDHLLFLLCLVIPFRRLRTLVPIVTAFTVAHSITLIASAYDMAPDALWFPPLVETLIAASIVYMALENILTLPGETGRAAVQRRWMVAFGFGLVHGFGFSFALRENLQFAGTHLLTSLLSFNVGVEIGQILVLVAMIPVLDLLFRVLPAPRLSSGQAPVAGWSAERVGVIVLSAFVAHTGWHWMLDRGARLWLYQFQWPAIDAALMVFVLRWLILAVAVAGVGWVIFTAARALPKLASASEGGSGRRGERDRIRPTGEGASV